MKDKDLAALFADLAVDLPPDPLDDLAASMSLREVTTDELALIFGVTDRRIGQLWQAGIIPEPRLEQKRYFFPLLQSVAGYLSFLREL